MKLLTYILQNSKIIFNEENDSDTPPIKDPDTGKVPKRPADREPIMSNILEEIKNLAVLVGTQQSRIDELVKEKEEKPKEIKETIENTPTIKEGDSGEIVASIVAKELEDFRNERKKEKEENEVKNYKEEILENKPWFKETFKSLQSKGALTSKKEIDNIVLTLDGLLKERWDEKNTASSAGMSIEELNKLASNKEPEKELTDEQKKLQKKKEQQNMYAKKYNDMLVKIYD